MLSRGFPVARQREASFLRLGSEWLRSFQWGFGFTCTVLGLGMKHLTPISECITLLNAGI